ncbi:MAG: hypothetical protein IJT62_03600 [Oscillospiraceae bacterium]|nr:hypothetical protein [Oscillospiraceae bacterium]
MKHRIARLLLLVLCAGMLTACGTPEEAIKAGSGFSDDKQNVGIFLDDPKELNALEEQPDILGWFEYWYGQEAQGKRQFIFENPAYTPFITWMPSSVPLPEIAGGMHDEYITLYLQGLAESCPDRPILIRFAHEMELRPEYGGGWYSWQYKGGENEYKAAWIHLVELGREICPQAKWIWAPNRADGYAAPFYPGDEYVDYVGVTLNHTSDRRYTYYAFEDFYVLEAARADMETYGKKIIICEASYSCDDEEVKANYLRSIFSYVKTDPHIVAVCLFNENKSPVRQFRFTDNEIFRQAYYEGVRELRNEK